MARHHRPGPRRRRHQQSGGFSLLELLIGASLLAIALLGHTASIFSEHKLSTQERARSTAMIAMEQFVERMRSDDDFAGLYARLNGLQEISRRSPEAAQKYQAELVEGYDQAGLLYGEDGTVNEDTQDTLYATWLHSSTNLTVIDDFEATRSGFVQLRDGRRAFTPQTYYDDFVTPTGIRTFHVAVEVPSAPVKDAPEAGAALREDLPLSRFGLPADLNGDGEIDDASHSDDYRTVPVIVTFRWTTETGAAEELRLSSWVWGYR